MGTEPKTQDSSISKSIEKLHFSIFLFSQCSPSPGPQPSWIGSGSPVCMISKEPKFLRRETSSLINETVAPRVGGETLLVFFFSALLLLDLKCNCNNRKAYWWGNKLQPSEWNNEKGTLENYQVLERLWRVVVLGKQAP